MLTALKGLVVPPISLLVLLLVGLLLALRWRRLGWWVSAASAAGLLVLAMPVSGALLLAALEADLPRRVDPAALPEAVVILSAEARAVDPAQAHYDPGPMTLERMIAGMQVARAARLPILVTGGVMQPGAPSLADIMAHGLEQHWNVPVRWREGRSRDTWQNAEFSAAMLREAGITRIYLVSHAWHLRRAIGAFTRFGVIVTAVPVRTHGPPRWSPEEFVPTTTGWVASFHAMHEWIGIAWYALR